MQKKLAFLVPVFLIATSAYAQEKSSNPVSEDNAKKAQNSKPGTSKTSNQDDKPTIIRQAGNYSAENPVVAIVVSHGQKETHPNPRTGKPYTGQAMADILAKRLAAAPFNTPSKTFVEEGGDFTSVVYL